MVELFGTGINRDESIKRPAIEAVKKHTSVPEITARKATDVISFLR